MTVTCLSHVVSCPAGLVVLGCGTRMCPDMFQPSGKVSVF